MNIVFASHNPGKLKEISGPLSQKGFSVKSLAEFTQESPEETGLTFVENALIKARFASKISGLPALADDSGLCVPVLNGEPGVRSARYAGDFASDQENCQKLLAKLDGIKGEDRAAYFVTVLVFLRTFDDPMPLIFEGKWHGEIALSPKGVNGFGYDPIFYLPELNQVAAELGLSEKQRLSHRAIALQGFMAHNFSD